MLTWAGYAVAASCIATYVWAALGRSLTPNLWANAIGGPIVAVGNARVGYWPAVVLEVFFTLAGVVGLARLWWQRTTWFPALHNVDDGTYTWKAYTIKLMIGDEQVQLGQPRDYPW